MENHVKKWLCRLSISTSLAIIVILLFTLVAMAIPGSVTNLIGVATSTKIDLLWVKAPSSTNTIIRHSTTGYPATIADGSNTYNGTASYTTLSGLTAGTTYYFSAWGYDGVDYSATALEYQITTLPSVSENITIPYPKPTIPAEAYQDPDASGWSISPIDDILEYFSDPSAAHGGLGMPVNNAIMFMAGVSVTFVSLGSYIKWRSFWTSWFIAIILCSSASSIGVMQWIIVGFLLLAGAGVWAVEKTSQ